MFINLNYVFMNNLYFLPLCSLYFLVLYVY